MTSDQAEAPGARSTEGLEWFFVDQLPESAEGADCAETGLAGDGALFGEGALVALTGEGAVRGDGALSALTGDGALCWTRGAGAGAALRGVLRTAGAGEGADGALYAERCFWTGALVAAGAFGAVAAERADVALLAETAVLALLAETAVFALCAEAVVVVDESGEAGTEIPGRESPEGASSVWAMATPPRAAIPRAPVTAQAAVFLVIMMCSSAAVLPSVYRHVVTGV